MTHTCTQESGSRQNVNAQGKNMNSSASESSLVPFILVQRPSVCTRKVSDIGKFCDTGEQGGVLLELDFGWQFGKSREG